MKTATLHCKCHDCGDNWLIIAKKNDQEQEQFVNMLIRCRSCGSTIVEVNELKKWERH